MNSEHMIRCAIASLMVLGIAAVSTRTLAAKGETEKCAGIAKAGKNDCGTSKNSCAGTVKVDRDSEAWVYVPKGACEKIAGGTVADKPSNTHGGAAAKK